MQNGEKNLASSNTLPPALQAAQQRAAVERGDPLPIDQIDMTGAMLEIAREAALASLTEQDKAQTPIQPERTPLTLKREEQTALLRWLEENNLLRVRALPLLVTRAVFHVYGVQLTTDTLGCWYYFQDTVGTVTEYGKQLEPYKHPNMNELFFTWGKMQDANKWVAWAKAMRDTALKNFPMLTISIEIEF
jgi:hypothetical protein